jgi:anthraniloyl-CoA monooxygenase
VWAHAYQFDPDTATFIVECTEETWAKFGFGDMTKEESIATCEAIFKDHLGGHRLMSNANHVRGSAWINFPRVLCERWSHENLALMGDAAATAHFSIGSGTKLALESPSRWPTISIPSRRSPTPSRNTRMRAAPRCSSCNRRRATRWNGSRRSSAISISIPVQFNYSLLTRSQRISHENLRLRDPEWLGSAEAWFQRQAGANANAPRAPMFAPFKLRGLELKNRVVVSPMAQYKASTAAHRLAPRPLCERAKGGAGLVYIEMTCVSARGAHHAGVSGLLCAGTRAQWKRIVDFVHRETDAKICAQLGHSGPKGSTQLGWEEIDAPLRTATGR